MHNQKFNLFIYGSLRDSRIFQSVSGYAFTRRPSRLDEKTLFAELAFLPHYRRVSPDNVYFYAVPDAGRPGSRATSFTTSRWPRWRRSTATRANATGGRP